MRAGLQGGPRCHGRGAGGSRPASHAPARAFPLTRTQPEPGRAPTAARVPAGPQDAAPDYTAIDAAPINRLMLGHFTRQFERSVGVRSPVGGYDAIIHLTSKLTSERQRPARDIHRQALQLFTTLLPAWLPPFFRAVFTRPAPRLAARINAFFTTLTCQWLMGPNTIADYEHSSGEVRRGQAVKIERCRYLETTGCASVCINCCKVPTQAFIREHMGLPVRITPDYTDFSCVFAYGEEPLPPAEDPAFQSPCFSQCPAARPHRAQQPDCGGLSLAELAAAPGGPR